MTRSIAAIVLAVSILLLNGCLLPESFTAYLHIDKDQNFTFRYEGTVVFAPLVYYERKDGSIAEMDEISEGYAAELIKEPGVVSAKPVEDGRISIVVEQRGRIRDQAEPLFGGITLKTDADQSVRLVWPTIPAKEDITRMDYRLDGKFRLKTDGAISSHNGTLASAGMLDNALTMLGLRSENPEQEVSWHITRENYRTLPTAVISGVTPPQNTQKALNGDIIFTSNVPNNDSAIKFATWYLQQVSDWKGDVIRWQIWKDAFFRGFAANATWLHREIQELKQIDLKVYRKPLTTADKLNGRLDVFEVYVNSSAMRSMELRNGATFDIWRESTDAYQPLIMSVEQTAEGWFIGCSYAIFGNEKAAALSPLLTQVDPRLANVKYPMRVEPGKPMPISSMSDAARDSRNLAPANAAEVNLPGHIPSQINPPPGQKAVGIPSLTSALPPSPEKLNLSPDKYQERRIEMFVALMHRDLADGKSEALTWRIAEPFIYNGKKTSRKDMEEKQKAYRKKWTMVREAPWAITIKPTGPDSYSVSYLVHHWAEIRQTGDFFSSVVAITLKIKTFAEGEYFQIAEWTSKAAKKNEGLLGPNEVQYSPLKAQRYKGVARHPDYDWPFVLEMDKPDSGGRFTGKITWINLGAVHKIHGKLHRDIVFFNESEVLSAGNALLGTQYTATNDENGTLQGTWSHMEVSRDYFSGGTWEMKPDP